MKKFDRSLFIIFTVLAAVFGNQMAAISQSVETRISADTLAAGDLVTLSIIVSKDQQYEQIIFPDTAFFGENFELRMRKRFRTASFQDSLAYQLQFWGVQNDTLVALPVQLVADGDTTTIFTRAIPITFRSVIESENPELRPLKPIFNFARAWWFYLLILVLLLTIAAVAWYYYKKQKEQPEPVPPPEFEPQPFLNPLRELENNLRQLKNIPESGRENFKQFYIDLGDAIRLYLEQMYNIAALESTSREILDELNRRSVNDHLTEDTRLVLNEADMVKFAKFEPSKQQAQKAFEKAEDFRSTVQKLHRNRIEMMKRQHLEIVEQERRIFQDNQKQNDQV